MPRHPPCALAFLTGNIYSYLILLGSNGIVTANLCADEIPYAGIFGFPKIIALMPCSSFVWLVTVTYRNFSRFLRKL